MDNVWSGLCSRTINDTCSGSKKGEQLAHSLEKEIKDVKSMKFPRACYFVSHGEEVGRLTTFCSYSLDMVIAFYVCVRLCGCISVHRAIGIISPFCKQSF